MPGRWAATIIRTLPDDLVDGICVKAKKTMRGILLASVTMLAANINVNAADIRPGADKNGTPAIIISGELVSGDDKKFEAAIAALNSTKKVFVYLDSPGGSLEPGLVIGYTIHKRGFETVVEKKCASMCGFIWLAGSTRWVFSNAHIGFHCVWEGQGECSSDGNAVIGAYLADLGLSLEAIVFLTKTKSGSMQALSAEDAKRLRIEAKTIPVPDVEDLPPRPPPPPPPPKTNEQILKSMTAQEIEQYRRCYNAVSDERARAGCWEYFVRKYR
jgi:hypothetical protein